jgi:UDP-N-acetylglucosamine:LPS N-acetylglucosamine transferase
VSGHLKVLAIASGGGHWVQLRRLRPAWAGCAVAYVTTHPGYRAEVDADPAEDGVPPPRFFVIPDANRWQKPRLLRQMLAVLAVLVRVRPHTVVSTGAAPGYFALRLGKLLGARTVWVDSIANVDELSLSGRRAGPHADLWLTQWEHLAAPEDSPGGGPDSGPGGGANGRPGPRFRGAVL